MPGQYSFQSNNKESRSVANETYSGGLSMPAVSPTQNIIQREIGQKGEAAVGMGVAKKGETLKRWEVVEAIKEDERWKYKIQPQFGNARWVWEDEPYDLLETETAKGPKAGQLTVSTNDVEAAINSPSSKIGATNYYFNIEPGLITLNHKHTGDVNCILEYKPLDEKTWGVENIRSRPYDKNGLGTVLVAAFYMLAVKSDIEFLTLTTTNTAPGFWSKFRLSQGKKTPLGDSSAMMADAMFVTDPPVEQQTYQEK